MAMPRPTLDAVKTDDELAKERCKQYNELLDVLIDKTKSAIQTTPLTADDISTLAYSLAQFEDRIDEGLKMAWRCNYYNRRDKK